MSAWDEATLSCIMSRGCEELGAACLRRPDAECREVCRRLIDCEMEAELDDCAVVCAANLPEETRQCILGSPCQDIDRACFGEQPDICRTACDKVVACGYDEDAAACYEACQANPDLQLIGCILAFPCESIGPNCLQ
jgi:hypothetical protein